jgi:hypothetical protein
VSAQHESVGPIRLGVDDAGQETALWQGYRGKASFISTASRSSGGGWSVPSTLSEGGGSKFEPALAVNASGEAVAVWERRAGNLSVGVQSAFRSPGGVWSGQIEAGQPAGSEPQVAIDAAGEAVLIWRASGGAITSASRPTGGTWGPPTTISATGEKNWLRLALSPSGEVVAAWKESELSGDKEGNPILKYRIVAASRPGT